MHRGSTGHDGGPGRIRVLRTRRLILLFVALCAIGSRPIPVFGQQAIHLTLDTAVDLAMGGSYRVRQIQLGVEQSRRWLEAERAGLKSRVYMNVSVPEIQAVSDYKWNSELRRDEIVRENTRRFQIDMAVQQPVVLFGYPTNGYLSLNNRMYRYTQLNGGKDITYYSRYYISFNQPFFQPNHLKYNIERAELNLERQELQFQDDIVDIYDDIADDYHELFGLAFEEQIYADLVAHLEEAVVTARRIAEMDTSRTIEVNQVLVELANAREQGNQAQSNFRLAAARIKQQLRLDSADSLYLNPVTEITPVIIDANRAIEYGFTLRPQLRRLSIQHRHDEIDLINAKGWDAISANLAVTYGRESQNPYFQSMWDEPTNSYSVGFHVYVPIWDWGRRNHRIQAEQIGLQRTELQIEQEEQNIRSEITNHVRNVQEYQKRALSMESNLKMAREISRESLRRYASGSLGIFGLLQAVQRERDTADNFLTAYLGYRRALLDLSTYTYYDFEQQMPLARRFEIDQMRGTR